MSGGSHQDEQAGGAQRIGTATGWGTRTTAGEGRPWWKIRRSARESPPGGGRAGGGGEQAVAEGESGLPTCRSEGVTGRGKDYQKHRPTLPAIEAGQAPRCVDENTLGRKASGLPEMGDGRGGVGREMPGVPSWRAATEKPIGWRTGLATPIGNPDALPPTGSRELHRGNGHRAATKGGALGAWIHQTSRTGRPGAAPG